MKNTNIYAGYHYSSQIISHETIINWCQKFGQRYCKLLNNNRGRLSDTWFLDEVFIHINGVLHYLWREVDQDGDEI